MNELLTSGHRSYNLEDLARIIEDEGKLGVGVYREPKTGLRCAIGALAGVSGTGVFYPGSRFHVVEVTAYFDQFGVDLTDFNDTTCASMTPEERAQAVALKIRSLIT